MVRHAAAIGVWLLLSASTLHAQDVMFTVTTASADVYKSPSMGGVVIGQARRGTSFEVTRELGSWVRILWPGSAEGAGYLHVSWGRITRGGLIDPSPTARRTMPSAVSSASTQTTQPLGAAHPPAPGLVSLPSHTLGVGGRMGSEAFGFALTGRAWTPRRYGVQVEARRSTQPGLVAADRTTTLQFAPSLLFSPKDVVSSAVWLRPYVGGGVNIMRAAQNTLEGDVSDSGLGYQMFGGAEMTWANLPQLAVSADLRRQWTPVPFGEGRVGRFGASLSLHWYLR